MDKPGYLQQIQDGVEANDLATVNEGLESMMGLLGKKPDLFQSGDEALSFLMGIRHS